MTLVLVTLGAAPGSSQLLHEVLAAHYAAVGGAKFLELGTVFGKGVYWEEGASQEVGVPFLLRFDLPKRARFSVEVAPGQEFTVLLCDGEEAWDVSDLQMSLSPVAEQALGRSLRRCDLQAYFPLRAVAEAHVKLLGKKALDGREAFVLSLDYPDGDTAEIWLDAETYLPFRTMEWWQIGDQTVEFERRLGDFRSVAGVMIPFYAEERNAVGWRRFQASTFELDVDYDEDLFRRAVPAPSASP